MKTVSGRTSRLSRDYVACCAKRSNYGKLRLLYLGIKISAVCIRNTGSLYGNTNPLP